MKIPTEAEMEKCIELKAKMLKDTDERRKIQRVGFEPIKAALALADEHGYEAFDYRLNGEAGNFYVLYRREQLETWSVVDPVTHLTAYDPFHYINKNEKKPLFEVHMDGKEPTVLDGFVELLMTNKEIVSKK